MLLGKRSLVNRMAGDYCYKLAQRGAGWRLQVGNGFPPEHVLRSALRCN